MRRMTSRVVWLFEWSNIAELVGLGGSDSGSQNHINFGMVFANTPGKLEPVSNAG